MNVVGGCSGEAIDKAGMCEEVEVCGLECMVVPRTRYARPFRDNRNRVVRHVRTTKEQTAKGLKQWLVLARRGSNNIPSASRSSGVPSIEASAVSAPSHMARLWHTKADCQEYQEEYRIRQGEARQASVVQQAACKLDVGQPCALQA